MTYKKPERPTASACAFLLAILLGGTIPFAHSAVAQGQKPTVILIGDSTVRNGSGKGEGGQWGWGAFLPEFFDLSKVNVVNKALGGRSSRTYQTEGLWDGVLDSLKPGDFVLIQFGHNDGGPLNTGRARLPEGHWR